MASKQVDVFVGRRHLAKGWLDTRPAPTQIKAVK